MPLSDHQIHYLPISSIQVNRDSRQRKSIKTEDLEKSIKKNGLFNPIIVGAGSPAHAGEVRFSLVAGERRLTACHNLGWKEIPCIFASDLSPVELSIIELEENIKRTDLPWQDIATAIRKIHQLNLQLDPDWTQAETADLCSVSPGHISECLLVANNLESPRVLEASSLREAYNILDRKFRRQEAESLEELLYLPNEQELKEVQERQIKLGSASPVSVLPIPFVQTKPQEIPIAETILHQSFLEYNHSGSKFNFIHCDFPYGIDIFEGPQGRGAEPQEHYLNTPEVYFTLVKHLCKSINSISSMSCHIMFWYAEKFKLETINIFKAFAPQVEWTTNPLIWLKSDNTGISPDPRRLPRHIYETALLGSTSSRELVQVKADAYACPTDHKVHPSTKPESMLRHFFTMLVDENTRMFDPTCGSGSSIRAAESLGAQQVLGLEVDWNYCEAARLELKKFRTMRSL